MIRKLLIANRGEIACRIMRTCQTMGIATVAVYADADADARHVRDADEAVHIGANAAHDSYLNGERLIMAAKRTGAQAIHPGYGFLSENAAFAQAVIEAGITWVGPAPETIEAMGDKRRAKLLLQHIPLIPGYNGDDQTDEALIAAAQEIGFPIMVKAAAGGGGKGMRAVSAAADLPDALAAARREASQAFSDSTLILERLIERPRHIEIQIIGDGHTVLSLDERECSIQRRHQKIIEETPSAALDAKLRARMNDAAVSIGRQLAYRSVGTVELLLDAHGQFYFMEMNTRLQVEHPVTEMTHGIDLVAWQIRIAEGETLDGFEPSTVPEANRHSLEVRLYAEDPQHEFLPTTGTILRFRPPSGPAVRVEAGIQDGDQVQTHYDPMLAKLVTSGPDRSTSIRLMDRALRETILLGVRTNIDFLRQVIAHPAFVAGEIDTGFLSRYTDAFLPPERIPRAALIGAALAKSGAIGGYWRNNPHRPLRQVFAHGAQGEATTQYEVFLNPDVRNSQVLRVNIGETQAAVRVAGVDDGAYTLVIDGHRQTVTVCEGQNDVWWVHSGGGTFRFQWVNPLPTRTGRVESEGSLRSPMPGTIIAVPVTVGQTVAKGDILLIIEAMKMEHRIKAPHAGVVTHLYFSTGQYVQDGVPLLDLQPIDAPS
ncbi:MAG: biotin carboxylase N-terminal domain-containing protein [bacterium]|nr:biotin carboxylase N-terminal domain-containing protein [bacterium]